MAFSPSTFEKEKSYEDEILQEFSNKVENEEMKSWTGVRRTKHDSISSVESSSSVDSPLADSSSVCSAKRQCGKKRGRRPSKIDLEAKLERSRQSARECRARKKLRYKGLEDMIADKERYVYQLREELEMVKRKSFHFSYSLILLYINSFSRSQREADSSETHVISYVGKKLPVIKRSTKR